MKRNFYKKITLLLAILLLATLIGACENQSEQTSATDNDTQPDAEVSTGEDIVLGALYPLTGPNAKTGQEFVDAIELAVDIVNNEYPDLGDYPFAKTAGIPSMGGAKLRVVTADTQGNPEVGATEAERLITSSNVDMLLGCFQSAVTKTASNSAEKAGVPFINSSSTSAELTNRGFEWFFRTGPSDVTFVEDTIAFMDQYKDEVGIETIAIVSEDTEFGMLFAKMFDEAAKAAGYNIVLNLSYPANTPNVSSEVIRIKDANPDVIVQLSYVSDAILFMKTYKDMDISPKMIIGQRAGFTTPEFITTLGDDADAIISTSAFSLDLANSKPFVGELNALFKEKSGVDLTTEYSRAMQTVFAVADALERAGSKDKDAFKEAMMSTNLGPDWMITPYDGVKYDETHQNVLAKGLIIQLDDGVYKTIWPEQLKVMDPIYPLPAWKDR